MTGVEASMCPSRSSSPPLKSGFNYCLTSLNIVKNYRTCLCFLRWIFYGLVLNNKNNILKWSKWLIKHTYGIIYRIIISTLDLEELKKYVYLSCTEPLQKRISAFHNNHGLGLMLTINDLFL